MEIQYTPAQQTAISLRGRSLLVSAAAGSGKTAVLTARIISRITDGENPADISRMLAVTFTKAAAAELKERIARALSDALMKNPADKRLSKQLIKLGSAKISTIHSFCYDLIRQNFEKLGLSATVRVADEAEMILKSKDVMNAVLESYYDAPAMDTQRGTYEFTDFAENFVSARDDKFADIMRAIYDKIMTYPEGLEFIRNCADQMRGSAGENFMESVWGNVIKAGLNKFLSHFEKVYRDSIRYFSDGGTFEKNYLPAFLSDHAFVVRIQKYLAQSISYDKLRDAFFSYAKVNLGRGVKKEIQTPESLYYKSKRDEFDKQRKKLGEQFFSLDEHFISQYLQKNADLCECMYLFLQRYENSLQAEKRKNGYIDFSDLERLTYRLLYDGDGNVTSYARSLANDLDELYIDEYQDVNELQDKIFTALSRPDNRFMVGDIKQSIYSFRAATPSLFSEYRNKFPKYPVGGDAAPSKNNTLFLSENFRCDESIVQFSNTVFGCLFRNNSGRVPYYEEDDLVFSKKYPYSDYTAAPAEIVLLEKNEVSEESMPVEEHGNEGPPDEAAEEQEHQHTGIDNRETEFVIGKIRSLIIENGYRPSDITILLRAKNSAAEFEEGLKRLNIPCCNTVDSSFFENAEILLMLCILNCIDNPMRDIYLVGALKSPIFAFTLDELVRIREDHRDIPFYEALAQYTAENEFSKGRYFLEKLAEYRKYANGQPVDRLIWYLYRDTALMAHIYADNKDKDSKNENKRNLRRANLMLLYEYARQFESGSFKGLYNFIRYVNDIIAGNQTLATAKAMGDGENAVKIMTIHQSKGLEFPVCFLCGTHKEFNRKDIKGDLLLERTLGLCSRLRDSTGFGSYDTMQRRAAAVQITENSIDEEMRILYVALTRAKERLIITASMNDPVHFYEQCAILAKFRHIDSYALSCAPTYIKWILLSVLSGGGNSCTIHTIARDTLQTVQIPSVEPSPDNPADTENQNDPTVEFEKIIRERFAYQYPYEHMTQIPAKLSVSQLYPAILDEDDTFAPLSENLDAGHEHKNISMISRPRFMEADMERASAAERGTATHVFMQFCDFKKVEASGIREEIARLVNNGFMTQSMADMIYIRQLEKFFSSPFYRQIRASKKMWREVRFNVKMPAYHFTENDELKQKLQNSGGEILVQGVIDCFFEDENGNIILVDYKTDYITQEQQQNPALAEAMLTDRHKRQILYYKTACEQMAKKPVSKLYIYSFGLGKEVEIRH